VQAGIARDDRDDRIGLEELAGAEDVVRLAPVRELVVIRR